MYIVLYFIFQLLAQNEAKDQISALQNQLLAILNKSEVSYQSFVHYDTNLIPENKKNRKILERNIVYLPLVDNN